MKTGIAPRVSAGIVFALGLALSAVGLAAETRVNLSTVNNIYGIGTPGTPVTGGGFDTGGGAYAGDLLGTSLTYNGVGFTLSAPGPKSAVTSTVIPLPAGKFVTLSFLGTAVNGPQTNQPFIVTYTDSTTSSFTQSLDDYGRVPQNFAGETVVTTNPLPLPYKITATGDKHTGTYRVFGFSFQIDGTKTVKSLTLPTNRNVGLLAVDLIPASTKATNVSLSGASSLFGISKPGLAVTGGGLDGSNSAYAGDLLGTSLVYSGDTYQFAAPGANSAASSTTLPLPTGNFTKLTILGTATQGTQTGQAFVVTYSDATSTTFTQSLSDWGSPQNYPNETVVKTLTYKIMSDGSKHTGSYRVYAYTFTLNSAKTVKSLKLPTNRKVAIIAANMVGTALPYAATPMVSPLPGSFTTAPTVTLTDSTAGATIYYTTDGTTPTTSSTKYTAPFKVAATGITTVEAMAVASGFSNSAVLIASYTVGGTPTPAATPTFSPTSGTCGTALKVTLSDATSGASIFYTTNNSTPTTASTKYTSAIAVSATTTIKAIATASGFSTSAVATGTFTISSACPPSALSYTTPPPLLIGKALSLSPSVTGTVTKYAVSPTLPSGLAINATTGVISGTPKTVTASAAYTITASNASGSTTFKLTLQVDSGPRVHLTATASTSNGAPLTFTWKVTDGVLTGTNGAQADWELPPGFGLHFAYVLVADGRGGYAEGRVVVNTDSFGAPQVITIKGLPRAVASPYQAPQARPVNLSSAASHDKNVTPAVTSGTMQIIGNVLLGDKNLPGVNDPFFGLAVGTTVSETSQACASSGCPAAMPAGLFGEYFFVNQNPGPAGNAQTLKALVQSATGTRSFTFSQADLDAGSARLPTLLIPGTAAPVISAMSATFNSTQVGAFELIFPNASGAPSDGYPQQNWFLSFLGDDDAPSACQYYLAVGAVTSCDSTGHASGGMKFTDWQKQVGIDNFATDGKPTALATYVNAVDLNLTRSHHSIRHDNADMGSYVCNHPGPVDSSGKPIAVNLPGALTADQQTAVNTAVSNANAGKNLVACVAMDYISQSTVNNSAQFTRFLVFGPSGELLPSVNLDGRGEKFVPGACVACHGGDNYSGKFGENGNRAPDIGSHFLPYDTGNFVFSTASGYTEAAQEQAIYQLNLNIQNTNPTVAVSSLFTNWYKAGQVLDKNYVPSSWQGYPDVYQQVVARSCRTCHAALPGYDWDALGPQTFAAYSSYVCDSGGTAGSQSMPNSKVTFDRLWNSRGTSQDQVAKLTSFYHTQGTLAAGSSCVLRAPPH